MTNGTSQGLFIVVAIVIFGIFVGLSYTLFGDELTPKVVGLFEQSTEQASGNLLGKPNNDNIGAIREDEKYLYTKIREANAEKNETEIWIQLEKIDDGQALKIVGSSPTDGNYTDSNAYGGADLTGEISLPDSVNNLPITEIGELAFYVSTFSGQLVLPSSLTSIENHAFADSTFSGELVLPSRLTQIGIAAFQFSKFSGELKLPSDLTEIGDFAFTYSTFSGQLVLPSSLTSIGYQTFLYSKFSGDLVLPSSLNQIGVSGFHYSTFSGELVLPSSLTEIEERAFYSSTFSGELVLPSDLTEIGRWAFYDSTFDKLVKNNPRVTIGEEAFYSSTF